MTERGVHKPGENSLRWNKTPSKRPPDDPVYFSPPKETKISKEREARRSQIAYDIERSMAIRCPMVPVREQDKAVYDEFWKEDEAA